MRAAASVLISSLVLGAFTFDYPAIVNYFSSSGSQQLLATKPKPKPNEPENPTPYRGSGRRNLTEHPVNTHPIV